MSVVAGNPCSKCGSLMMMITVLPGQNFTIDSTIYMAGSTFTLCSTCDFDSLKMMSMVIGKDVVKLCSHCESVEIDPGISHWANPLCRFCRDCARCRNYEVMEETAHWDSPICNQCHAGRPGSCTCWKVAPCSYCTDEWDWEAPTL